jgi:hypothetical protein
VQVVYLYLLRTGAVTGCRSAFHRVGLRATRDAIARVAFFADNTHEPLPPVAGYQ